MEKAQEQAEQGQPRTMGQEMKAWLESRPELMRRLEEMRRICGNEQGEHKLLAQAEAGLVEQLDATGRELIGAWLEKREAQEHERAKADPTLRAHSKKNCESRHSSAPRKRKSA
jgi:hypothetical protein